MGRLKTCCRRIALKTDRNEREMKVQSCSKRVPNQARRSSSAPTLATALGERGQLPLAVPERGLPGSGTTSRYLLLLKLFTLSLSLSVSVRGSAPPRHAARVRLYPV